MPNNRVSAPNGVGPRDRRPNILLITTDQQRGDCLGCDGHPVVETPYLDELAARGCRFQHAYTAVASCVPARAAILTGMEQWNHGRLAMTGTDYLEYPATLPGELTRAHYQTQGVGKMHFHPQRGSYGFEHTVLDESGRRKGDFHSDYHQWFEQHKDGAYGYRDHSVGWNSWMARPTHLPEHLHPTAWTAEEGIRFIRDRDPIRPFFLWLSFARPHAPYDAPQCYFDMYDGDPQIPMPVAGDWSEKFRGPAQTTDALRGDRPEKEARRARAGYYGNITFIDHQIGLLLQEFQRLYPEEWSNTLIVFTSDHGDMLGDHHHWRKNWPFEGSSRIPMIVAPPPSWQMPGGQVSDRPVELRDVMPTLLDAAGVGIPDSVDGRSLLDVMRGTDENWRDCVQGDCHTGDLEGCQYITNGAEKYIWFHHTNEEYFFDLASDPREEHDLSARPEYSERVAFWRKRLAEIDEDRGDRRGKDGELIPIRDCDPEDQALSLTPNYHRWKERGARRIAQNRWLRPENPVTDDFGDLGDAGNLCALSPLREDEKATAESSPRHEEVPALSIHQKHLTQ